MKAFVVFSLVFFAGSVFADQTINCFEINKDGSRKVKGGSLKAELAFTSSGSLKESESSITLKGFWKRGSQFGKNFTYLSASQSKPNAENSWAHVYFNDAANGEMVEYQLQFNSPILDQAFTRQRAVLAIGVENTSSEAMPSWGFPLMCSSRLE
jgi:hypothetical protein